MELQFQKQEVNCLGCVLSQVQNLEQTQELRLPEGMQGVDRILGCWGQVMIRSKQWQRQEVRVTGGTMVWLLYAPEEGTGLQKLETWIPFQMDWDLPGGAEEGAMQVLPLLRFADARPIAAGKVMIRIGIGVLVRCWSPKGVPVYKPQEVPEDVELLQERYPVRLPREAGEKQFALEEELTLPASMPRLEKILYQHLEPVVTDKKVLANKVVFRGIGSMHLLYLDEEGQPHSWDTQLPFSQYAPLEGSYSPDAQAEVTMAVTAMELEGDTEGNLRLKAELTGQYLVDDREILELTCDAGSPLRAVEVKQQALDLPAVLESRREIIRGEQTLPVPAEQVVDALLLPDFPRQRREGDSILLEQTAMAQLLTRDRDGGLRGTAHRLEGQLSLKADEHTVLTALPGTAEGDPVPRGEELALGWGVPVQVQATGAQDMEVVSALELGEAQAPDPARPTWILRRAGTDRLWDMARQSGSTVEAIRQANDLQGQPEPGRMLLIPVI